MDEHLGPQKYLNVKILGEGLTLKITLMCMVSVYLEILKFIFKLCS
jgi:hypothetical protein